MADEITLTWKVTFSKGGTEFTFPDAAKREIKISVTGSRFLHGRQSIGTSVEALQLGEVVTGGMLFGVNRDATNYIEIRSGGAGADLVRAKAGEPFFFRVSADTAAPNLIANTAACEVEYVLIED